MLTVAFCREVDRGFGDYTEGEMWLGKHLSPVSLAKMART